jgi:S1-C subfamily serine protease
MPPSPWSAPIPSSPPLRTPQDWTESNSTGPGDGGPGDGDGSRNRRTRSLGLIAVVASVALIAGMGGAFLGNQISDNINQPPTSASNASIDVAAPGNLSGTGIDVAKVAKLVGPSVVTVVADLDQGQSLGTGIIISSDGEILTNGHVINGAKKIRVRLAGETEPRDVSLLAEDVGNDMALLRMKGSGFQAATFADPNSIHIGEDVVAIGFALGLDGDPSVTSGIVSALNRTIATENSTYLNGLIQTDAAISSGNSGGPLVNAAGQVVGMNTAVARSDSTTAASNVGFAISAKEALPIIKALREQANGAQRPEAYLGVSLGQRTDGGQGAIVTSIEPGTPAASSGLKEGDLVVAVDGSSISGSPDLIATVRDHTPGDKVTVTVMRNGEKKDVEITLTQRPQS